MGVGEGEALTLALAIAIAIVRYLRENLEGGLLRTTPTVAYGV